MSKSKLRDLEELVLNITDLESTKAQLMAGVKESITNVKDSNKLCLNIARCSSIVQLQQLFYNSLLKFEKLGVL